MAFRLPKLDRRHSVAVFCGSGFGDSPKYRQEIEKLGAITKKLDWRLVYGAGSTGLMGAVARARDDKKTRMDIYAVTQKIIRAFERPIRGILFRTADTMQERKREFLRVSDAFIIFPGGIGTLDEFFDILVEKDIRFKHHKIFPGKKRIDDTRPLVLVNINGYYDPLIRLLKDAARKKFAMKEVLGMFAVAKNAEEAARLAAPAKK